MERIKIESKSKVMKGEKKTIRCNHCFEKFTYAFEDIKKTRDSYYGMISTVRCPKCKRVVTIR